MADDNNTDDNNNTNASANSSNSTVDWRESLGDLSKHERISGFKTTKELAQAYIDSPLPRKLPESVDGYTVPQNIKIKGLRKMALENKISQNQLDGILAFNKELTDQSLNDIKERRKGEVQKLKEEWGNDYDKNIKVAEKALKHYDTEDGSISKLLKNNNMKDNPTIMRFMHKLGSSLKEDSFVGDSGNVKKPKSSLASRLFPDHPKRG